MMSNVNLPDVLIAAVSEVAAADGEQFDDLLVRFIYEGICNWQSSNLEKGGIDLIALSLALEGGAA